MRFVGGPRRPNPSQIKPKSNQNQIESKSNQNPNRILIEILGNPNQIIGNPKKSLRSKSIIDRTSFLQPRSALRSPRSSAPAEPPWQWHPPLPELALPTEVLRKSDFLGFHRISLFPRILLDFDLDLDLDFDLAGFGFDLDLDLTCFWLDLA